MVKVEDNKLAISGYAGNRKTKNLSKAKKSRKFKRFI